MSNLFLSREQVAYLEELRSIPPEEMCYCGWNRLGECPNHDGSKTGVDRRKELQALEDKAASHNALTGHASVSNGLVIWCKGCGGHRSKCLETWTKLDQLIDAALLFPGIAEYREELVLAGSAPLAVAGLRDVNDLDLLMPDGWLPSDELEEVMLPSPDSEYEEPETIRTIRGEFGKIETFNHFTLPGFSAAEARETTYRYRGMKLLQMDIVRRFKETVGRDKDIVDLKLMRKAGLRRE